MASIRDQIQELDNRYLSAAANGMVAAIQGAVVGGADKLAVDGKGQGALHLAAAGGHLDAVRYLCDTVGLDVNARDADGNTPLLTAIGHGSQEVAEYLVQERQADITVRDRQGRGIVWKAAENCNTPSFTCGEALLKFVLSTADTLDEIDNKGHTPLRGMVERHGNGLEVALLAGADPVLKGEQEPQSLLDFARKEKSQMAELLLETFSSLPRALDISRLTHDALVAENTDGKRLLDNPVIWRKMPEILDVLEQKGQKLPTKEELSRGGVMGYPPLALAAFTGQFAAAEHCLASHGEAVTAGEYWNHDHSGLGMFGKAALETGLLQAEFTPGRAAGRGARGTQEFYHALPQEARDAVPNYRQLVVRLSQQEQHTGRGR